MECFVETVDVKGSRIHLYGVWFTLEVTHLFYIHSMDVKLGEVPTQKLNDFNNMQQSAVN